MPFIPKIVFIVPYRNRPQHKFFFSNYVKTVMENGPDYEIYFSHQCDVRTFNRGATKNIGFLAVKNKYPNHYKDITFVFNDIDTIPFSNIFDYETVAGIVKHFYGFKYALGGIVALKGGDFEATNGYPNFWGWGMEDNVLQKRCEKIGLTIDRTQFYPIGSPEILHLFDGVSRIINSKDPWRATHDNGIDGLKTINKLNYTIDKESSNPLDNIYTMESSSIFIINISTFMTGIRFEHDNYHKYDLREPPRKIIHPDKIRTNKVDSITDDWTNIPYYPSAEKKQELINQYGIEQTDEIIEYNLDNSNDPMVPSLPPYLQQQQQQHLEHYQKPLEQPLHLQQQHLQQQHLEQQPNIDQIYLEQIKLYNESLRAINSNQRIIPNNVNKYSKEYSKIIAAKPRATASVNIRMGGVY